MKRMLNLASTTVSKRFGLVCMLAAALANGYAQTEAPPSTETLDRVVAVVNHQAILSSDKSSWAETIVAERRDNN